MNITDVGHLVSDADVGEDKMEKGSEREGKSAWEIARFYSDAFFSDFEKTRLHPTSDHLQGYGLYTGNDRAGSETRSKRFTYRTSDGIYFDSFTISPLSRLREN